MSMTNKLGKRIPADFKAKIPFYKNVSSFNINIMRFSDMHKVRKRFISDKRFIPYENEIKKLHNIHKGQRCFILATGPSLQKTNVKILKDEILFGVNTLVRGLPDIGIKKIDYYAVSDYNIFNLYSEKLLALDTTLFLGGHTGQIYLSKKEEYEQYKKNEPILVRSLGRLLYFGWKTKDITKGTYSTHLIPAAMCLPIAYYMGFKEVYLLGADCDFTGKKHHFDGFKATKDILPNYNDRYWAETFKEFEILKEGFEENGRKIYNSTIGGKLEVFERKKIEDVI